MAASNWGGEMGDGVDLSVEMLGFISFSPTYRATGCAGIKECKSMKQAYKRSYPLRLAIRQWVDYPFFLRS